MAFTVDERFQALYAEAKNNEKLHFCEKCRCSLGDMDLHVVAAYVRRNCIDFEGEPFDVVKIITNRYPTFSLPALNMLVDNGFFRFTHRETLPSDDCNAFRLKVLASTKDNPPDDFLFDPKEQLMYEYTGIMCPRCGSIRGESKVRKFKDRLITDKERDEVDAFLEKKADMMLESVLRTS